MMPNLGATTTTNHAAAGGTSAGAPAGIDGAGIAQFPDFRALLPPMAAAGSTLQPAVAAGPFPVAPGAVDPADPAQFVAQFMDGLSLAPAAVADAIPAQPAAIAGPAAGTPGPADIAGLAQFPDGLGLLPSMTAAASSLQPAPAVEPPPAADPESPQAPPDGSMFALLAPLLSPPAATPAPAQPGKSAADSRLEGAGIATSAKPVGNQDLASTLSSLSGPLPAVAVPDPAAGSGALQPFPEIPIAVQESPLAGQNPQTFIPGLHALAQAAALPPMSPGLEPPVPTTLSLQVPVAVTHPQWGAAVGEQLMVAVGQGRHHAELRLDPPDLGPVSVHISIDGDRVGLSFVAPASAARDALDQALPDLRAAFTAQGLNLAQTDISREGQGQSARPRQGMPLAASGADTESTLTSRSVQLRPLSLIDYYA
jgi:flagellar hook-length control protein FliK